MVTHVDGLVITDCNRSGANAFPNEHQFVIPATYLVGGSAVKTGDLCVLFDLANNNTAAIPSLVTPTGFTDIPVIGGGAQTGSDSLGNGARCAASYKILVDADAGATFTGMNGTENERKMVCVFRPTRPIQSVTANNAVYWGPESGDPGSLFAAQIGGNDGDGNYLIIGMACAENAVTSIAAWSPSVGNSVYADPSDTLDEIGAATATRALYVYYPTGLTGPASGQTFDVGDFSTFDTTTQCILILKLT